MWEVSCGQQVVYLRYHDEGGGGVGYIGMLDCMG